MLRARARGFTLPELLVTLILLALGTTLLTDGLHRRSAQATDAFRERLATQALSNHAELVRATPWGALADLRFRLKLAPEALPQVQGELRYRPPAGSGDAAEVLIRLRYAGADGQPRQRELLTRRYRR